MGFRQVIRLKLKANRGFTAVNRTKPESLSGLTEYKTTSATNHITSQECRQLEFRGWADTAHRYPRLAELYRRTSNILAYARLRIITSMCFDFGFLGAAARWFGCPAWLWFQQLSYNTIRCARRFGIWLAAQRSFLTPRLQQNTSPYRKYSLPTIIRGS